ncbi:MAG: hypothetical protein IVW55_11095 [Chloroflexi bacterium]|nr:hypothetical protein [Chloroflexota bacterium]
MSKKERSSLSIGILVLLLLLVASAGWLVARQTSVPVAQGSLRPAGAPASNGVSTSADPVSAGSSIMVGRSYANDISRPLREITPVVPKEGEREEENENPPIRIPGFKDETDSVVQRTFGSLNGVTTIPAPNGTYEGIDYPGVSCNCAPPDTNGEAGLTEYVQMVNEGVQVFDKSTGASLYGPLSISSFWSGFGGVCETGGAGDPVVLYDQLANRWVISQFAGGSTITDECIAVSTTSDATGSYYRYGFHLGSNFFDYPHLGVWPDGYYASFNVFNSAGTSYLGPQPVAFDRATMLSGQSATFQTTSPLGSGSAPFLPADLDGSTPPPTGAPNHYAEFGNPLKLFNFHVDWGTPANSTFLNYASLAVAGFTQLCSTGRNCIPQPGTSTKLDGIGDRLMFRAAYRNFGDHESMVLNHSVNVGSGQAGVRWYELRSLNSTPTVYQQGSYAPDATNRWMGSAAMDSAGDIAVGYSASSSSVYPSLRYAGRLSSDPLGQLPQGEATMFAGLGSQASTGNRWGDYSDMTVDPADDCTFWYTNEYYPSGATQYNWRTRFGSFKFPGCGGAPQPTPTNTAVVSVTNTPLPVATNTPIPPTATATPNPNAPDFTLSVSPPSLTVARGGANGIYTVTLTSQNNFSGDIRLTVSGLPGKTSGTFSPNPVALAAGTTKSATLTINAQRGGPTGAFTLTVTGTNGGTTHSQNVTLTITR